MDIKAKVDEVVNKVKSDPGFSDKFKNEPVKAVEDVIGVDLPDDVINNVVETVKSKINFDGIASKLGGLFGGNK